MEGNVVSFNDSDGILNIAHAGSTDGKFREFLTSTNIVGLSTNAQGIVTAVTDNMAANTDNDVFDTIGDSFIDFSESNPFGDPE